MGRRALTFNTILLLAALVALLVDRARILFGFAFRYTDHDQTLLWYTVRELLHGRVHEPMFYGQSYNPPAEAWLAVPLAAMGMPVWIALPLVACLLGLLPYLLFGGIAWWKRHDVVALIVLLVPLILPWEYAMITAIPRGFVAGIAAGAIACAIWMFRSSRAWFAVAGALALSSIVICPNAVLLVVPMGAYALAKHLGRRDLYIFTIIGLLIALPVPLGAAWFYRAHPEYLVHDPPPLSLSLAHFGEVVSNLHLAFGDFEPLVDWGWPFLLAFIGIVLLLAFLRDWPMALAGAVGVAGTILSLALNRVDISAHSTLLPTSRFFLALPVLLMILVVGLLMTLEARVRPMTFRRLGLAVAVVAGVLLVPRHATFDRSAERALRNAHPVYVATIDELHEAAERMDGFARQCDASLLIIPMYEHLILNYSIPVLTDGRVETLFPPYERRTWRLREEAGMSRPRIMLDVTARQDLYEGVVRHYRPIARTEELPHVVCFDPAGATTLDVARTLDLGLRDRRANISQPPSMTAR